MNDRAKTMIRRAASALALCGVVLQVPTAEAGLGDSDDCEVNVGCEPYGTEWEREIRSIVKWETADSGCSGALLANPKGLPLILTAYHCVNTDDNPGISAEDIAAVGNAGFSFNFRYSTCTAEDEIFDAPFDNRTFVPGGAKIVAIHEGTDLVLLQLNGPVPSGAFYSGWSVEGDLPNAVLTLAHPQLDAMKVSMSTGDIYHSEYNNKKFIEVKDWTVGSIEYGSSGGPLFDLYTHRILGAVANSEFFIICGVGDEQTSIGDMAQATTFTDLLGAAEYMDGFEAKWLEEKVAELQAFVESLVDYAYDGYVQIAPINGQALLIQQAHVYPQ
jgi:hypothetical protein